jgi:hypothetical protein
MNMQLFNSTLDVLAQKGILTLLEATGFYYLFVSVHADPFILSKALIGLSLVLTGALFEYLITLAKVSYLNNTSAQRVSDIQAEKDLLEGDRRKILDELESLKSGKNVSLKE